MIKQFSFEKFGPLSEVKSSSLSNINLIIGSNSVGKTFLLKSLYSLVRSQEEYNKGDDRREFDEVLSDKLYWTFQIEKLSDLVQKGSGSRLKASVTMSDNTSLAFEIGQDTNKKISSLHNNLSKREANSIFLPPKEVLTLSKVILKSGLQDKSFGFDATYVDLVLALQNPTQMGRNYEAFKTSRNSLEKMFQGKIEFDTSSDKWIYKKGNSKFSINTTAEGIKKIAILDTLLGNRYLSPSSVIFIDEPESALHPVAISQLLEIISILAEKGIQFFMATHSFFVVKKLYLIAKKKNIDLPIFLPNEDDGWKQENLKNGIPDNEIINESIRLFDEELEVGIDG
ncbi:MULTISPECIES: AAA family ATPase [unclassified Sulfurospirillum]|uniref:AAA family ATPase n=1 Tax=unclassified Sulfurospirillum TaxID=2618290 RepID=UPI0005019D9B|nr:MULTISPECIES: AAA family ATPase [unclassified Sulfurospirillum]KFL34033.1 ATPase [Sulfurospirillum sp. SCADC]